MGLASLAVGTVRAQSGAPIITSPPVADYGWVVTTPDISPAYHYQVTATNSPTSFGAAGLPFGGSIDSQRGIISGLATIPGIFRITVTATNGTGTGTSEVTLRVHAAPEGASLSNGRFQVGDTISAYVAFNGKVVVTGQPAIQNSVLFRYASGSGTSQLVFTHTVTAADPGGRIYPYFSWVLDQGSVTDANGLTATSAIPTPRVGSPGDALIDPSPIATTGSTSGRLVNLSVLTTTGPGSQVLTLGFVIGGGQSGATQPLLLRGVGPGLAPFNVAGYVADPALTLFSRETAIAFNDNWDGLSAVRVASTTTGAFRLPDGSADAALVTPLAAGAYTMQISAPNAGSALAEIYDMSAPSTNDAPHLVNLSCLTQLGTEGTLTCGFVISGSTSRRLLIRAAGPALAGFGVTNVMTNPALTLYESGATGSIQREQNSGWGGAASLASTFQAVGAFPFSNGDSADSAIVITLAPGNYSVQVRGANRSGGVVLVEVYDVP